MRLVFAIYDMLPLLHREMFPLEIEPMVRRWLDALAMIADGLVCISRTVAGEVLKYPGKPADGGLLENCSPAFRPDRAS